MQLGLLCRGRSQDFVGYPQHAAFTIQAIRALFFGFAGGNAVLHLAQGVKHVHNRDAPPGLQLFGGQARHPVMAVNDIIADAALGGKLLDASHKLWNVFGQFTLGHGLFRPGGDVDNAVAKPQVVQDVRDVLILRAGKNIDVYPLAAQFGRQIADVNVHAAGVFAPQGRKRTGMVRNHGDFEHIGNANILSFYAPPDRSRQNCSWRSPHQVFRPGPRRGEFPRGLPLAKKATRHG